MFPKVLKKILWILLWGGLLAFPTLEASAQFDASAILRNQNNQNPNDPNNPNNMLGSNPFQTQNGEEQPAMPTDSTKKKRIRKPLESYFFNDSIRALPNFSWTISRDYNQVHINPLDTTLRTASIPRLLFCRRFRCLYLSHGKRPLLQPQTAVFSLHVP